jgi:hypothetical protein
MFLPISYPKIPAHNSPRQFNIQHLILKQPFLIIQLSMKSIYLWSSLAVVIAFSACGGKGEKEDFQPWAVDRLARDMDSIKNFSIILYDMDIDSTGKYLHKYKIVVPKSFSRDSIKTANKDSLANMGLVVVTDSAGNVLDSSMVARYTPEAAGFDSKITEWIPVTKKEFDYHANNMGMEILSKEEGEINKVPAPPGYNHYVGNPQYGQWQQNPQTGETFWSFYGKYMFIQSMFNLLSPARFGDYDDYRRNYRYERPYYGGYDNGRPRYGTSSSAIAQVNPGFYNRYSSNPSFRDRVNSSIERSKSMPVAGARSQTSSSGRSSFGSTSGSSTKRYSSGSSSSSSSSRSSGWGSSSSSSRRSSGGDSYKSSGGYSSSKSSGSSYSSSSSRRSSGSSYSSGSSGYRSSSSSSSSSRRSSSGSSSSGGRRR